MACSLAPSADLPAKFRGNVLPWTSLRIAADWDAIFHDLRRTAATELRRAGVPEDVAMQITGHRTRSMFSRYNIVDLNDVSRALEQRETYLRERLAAEPSGPARRVQ